MKKLLYILLILTGCTTTNVTEKTVIVYDTIPYPVVIQKDSVVYDTNIVIKDSIRMWEVEKAVFIPDSIPFYYPISYLDTVSIIRWVDSIRWKDSIRIVEKTILKTYIDTFYVQVYKTIPNIIKTLNWVSKSSFLDNYTLMQNDNLEFQGYFEHYNDSLVGSFYDMSGNFNKEATFIFHRLDSLEMQITHRNGITENYNIDLTNPFRWCPDTITTYKTGWRYLTHIDTAVIDTIHIPVYDRVAAFDTIRPDIDKWYFIDDDYLKTNYVYGDSSLSMIKINEYSDSIIYRVIKGRFIDELFEINDTVDIIFHENDVKINGL